MMAGKKTPCINDTEGPGLARRFMARESGASEMSVARVLYGREHDAALFLPIDDGDELDINRLL
jgi:hypothetical protein